MGHELDTVSFAWFSAYQDHAIQVGRRSRNGNKSGCVICQLLDALSPRWSFAASRAMLAWLTEHRHAQLATAQHQNNQDDDHNENNGSDTDIH
jgi:hypothetical protein